MLSGMLPVTFLISCDTDDTSMNNETIKQQLSTYDNVYVYYGPRVNKIEAINRDIDKHMDFDLLIVSSDDMEPVINGYDAIFAKLMCKYFPDFDGVLNSNDGHVGKELNTLPVIGKKYYERFGYIFYPEYQSVYCDLELCFVSKYLQKEAYINKTIFMHNHPCYGFEADSLCKHNESPTLARIDAKLFYKRFTEHFGLTGVFTEKTPHPSSLSFFGLKDNKPILWSILICTVEERSEAFKNLYAKLLHQIKSTCQLANVEVVYYKDNKEASVGFKRNMLVASAKGKYVSFIDDDDDVADNYVRTIIENLQSDPDCLSLTGIITTKGKDPKKFFHSLHFKDYIIHKTCYTRPPCHLNVIKRSIASQIRYREIDRSEDYHYAMDLRDSGLIKTENFIGPVLYYYLFDPEKSLTQSR
ncbi:MAG: hypothetical protein S4CHLAM37_12160 [Chlamydiia bacterium]|nr:hypothetical protein [Chlamydiia bacterium]